MGGRGGKGLDVQITARVFVSTQTHRVGEGGHFQPETSILAMPCSTSHGAAYRDKLEGFNIGMRSSSGRTPSPTFLSTQNYQNFFGRTSKAVIVILEDAKAIGGYFGQ